MSRDRLERFASALDRAGFVAAIVSYPRDVYYLAGTAQPCNLLVVPGRAPRLFARRFVELARAESVVEDVIESASFRAVRESLDAFGLRRGRIGMTLDVVPANLFRKAAAVFDGFEVDDVAPLLTTQRMVKDEEEIVALRRAAEMFSAAHEAIVAHLAPGVSEADIAAEVISGLRREGHDGMVFYRRWDGALQPEGGIASGENLWTISGQAIAINGTGLGRAVPFGASRRVLRDGDLLNIDVGLCRDGYHGDVARTYAVGEPSPEIVRLAVATRQIQDAALDAIRPGVAAEKPYRVALETARELGVDAWFQGYERYHGPYIGHGLGLELDEPPVLGPGAKTEITAGMVLAVEPKLVVPGVGAVNIEDTVVVDTDAAVLLGDLPRTLFSVAEGLCTCVATSERHVVPTESKVHQ